MATLRLGDIAPDFVQDSTEGSIHFHQWAGKDWVVLFSHPADSVSYTHLTLPTNREV